MPEVIGIDHIYVAVTDLERSERFYDVVMEVLGFRKNSFVLADDRHVQYFNRHFGYVLRPAKTLRPFECYAPGLHHFCFRVEAERDVREVARKLKGAGIDTSEAKSYPDYAPDYVAVFFEDPDGLRLEVTNYRKERRHRHDHWDRL
jgi:glyoxylase I family protein